MFKRIGIWLLMTIAFSALYIALGFQDTIFLLTVTIMYLLVIHVRRLEPPPAKEIMVEAKQCEACERMRAKNDLVAIKGSREFSTGFFEWKVYVCFDNADCKEKGLAEVERIVKDEEMRREAVINGKT